MGWLCDLVNNTGFQVFGGSFFGALCGYGFSRLLDWQETNARRHELLALLNHQFSLLDPQLPRFDPAIARYLDPVDLHAARMLLDGKVLNYFNDSYLIRCLDMLRQSVDKYNEYARSHNQGELLRDLAVEERLQIYAVAQSKYGLIIQGMHSVNQILVTSLQELQRRWWYRAWRWVWRWYRPKVIVKTDNTDQPSPS